MSCLSYYKCDVIVCVCVCVNRCCHSLKLFNLVNQLCACVYLCVTSYELESAEARHRYKCVFLEHPGISHGRIKDSNSTS